MRCAGGLRFNRLHGGRQFKRKSSFRLLLTLNHVEQGLIIGPEIANQRFGLVLHIGQNCRAGQENRGNGGCLGGNGCECIIIGIAGLELQYTTQW